MIRYTSTCSNTRFNNILCDVVSLLDLVLRGFTSLIVIRLPLLLI